MNRGDQRNASSSSSGQRRSRAKVGSSSASTPMHGGAGSSNRNDNANNSRSKRKEEDVSHIPGTNVVKIMRRVIPANAKITDEAKEAVQECVKEYISFITGEANERCLREHRKTLTPEDILCAMAKLGFDDYVQPLTLYLNRYRESESQRTTVDGEPHVFRTVNYQLPQGPHHAPPPLPPPASRPLLPPPLPPPVYYDPQFATPPPPYFINPADEAMSGFHGYRVAPPGSTIPAQVDASPSATVAYAPTSSTGDCPHSATYPPTLRNFFERQFPQ